MGSSTFRLRRRPLKSRLIFPLNTQIQIYRKTEMKNELHPDYQLTTITCACGNVLETRSTVKDMHVNTCSACHPFYTGQSTFIDAEGRVEQFRKRYAAAAAAAAN